MGGSVYEGAVTPLAGWIGTQSAGVDQWTAFVGVMALGFVGLSIAVVLLYRHLRAWQLRLFDGIDDELRPIESRLERLEQNTAGLQATNDAINVLHGRLVGVEPIPPTLAQDEWQRHLLMAHMSGPRVTPLGKAEN